jgi:hypothetical protein
MRVLLKTRSFKSFVFVFIFGALYGCGAPESNVGGTDIFQAGSNGKITYFRALNPLFLAFDRYCPGNPNPATCNNLIPVTRTLQLNEYDAFVEPDLSADHVTVNSLVTGIGIEAVDYQSATPFVIHLGVIGRQFDSSTGKFLNNFRTFSAQGETFDGAQDFSIQNAIADNIFMTGLGLRLHGGHVSKLEIQKKMPSKLMQAGPALTASTRVTLDNGWAAVGFIIRVSPPTISSPMPYLQDVLMYTGQLVSE